MREYLLYPGCSLQASGRPYGSSLHAVFRKLGLRLVTLENWNCCGATAYLSVDSDLATALAARNLALAEASGDRDLVAPCSGCFLALTKAQVFLRDDSGTRTRVREALQAGDLTYRGRVRIRHPLEVLKTDVGIPEIRKQIVRTLRGFRFAAYYGCALVRPYGVDDPHTPTILEAMMETTGADATSFPYRTRCCGAMLTAGIPEIGHRLTEILLAAAKDSGAHAIVTACPLCHHNLEAHQARLSKAAGRDLRIPVMYFTQVLGLGLGLSREALAVDRLLREPAIEAVIA